MSHITSPVSAFCAGLLPTVHGYKYISTYVYIRNMCCLLAMVHIHHHTYYVTSSYILCHIIIHTMSHHHTYYVTFPIANGAYTCKYISICMHICFSYQVHIYLYPYMILYVHMYRCVCVCVCVCARVCVYVCVCVCIHARIQT